MKSSFKIKGKTWKIKRVKSLRSPNDGQLVMGLCEPAKKTISVDASLTGDVLTATILHELNHAIFTELYVLLDIQIEEIIVEGFADVYTELFFSKKK